MVNVENLFASADPAQVVIDCFLSIHVLRHVSLSKASVLSSTRLLLDVVRNNDAVAVEVRSGVANFYLDPESILAVSHALNHKNGATKFTDEAACMRIVIENLCGEVSLFCNPVGVVFAQTNTTTLFASCRTCPLTAGRWQKVPT